MDFYLDHESAALELLRLYSDTGNKRVLGNGEWGMGHWGMENGAWGIENFLDFHAFYPSVLPCP